MYVGASENQLLTNLSRLDHEEPCIALLDEVEKVFASSTRDCSGTTSSMLSQLLWWLAERRSRVFVVMTTNNAKALPRELYREGRVDQVFWLGGLTHEAAVAFAEALLATFDRLPPALEDAAEIIAAAAFTRAAIPGTTTVSHAAVTATVYDYVKLHSS